MLFDRETTIVITKFNNLTEAALVAYCQNFGKVIRCFIKPSTPTRNKEPYALVKFAEPPNVAAILSHRNHTINGIHVLMRSYHYDTNNPRPVQTPPSLMSIHPYQSTPNNNNSLPRQIDYDQLIQENLTLKHDLAALQKSLVEAQAYSKTAYETFQILREKYEAEQTLTNKLKQDYSTMVESYENRLKQQNKDTIKEEPNDSPVQNQTVELQIIKNHLEQAQIDLGKCQTENAILNAKLASRERQFDVRFNELNNRYTQVKAQYEHVTTCIKDFHRNLNSKMRIHAELKQEAMNLTNENSNDDGSSEDIIEIVMQTEVTSS